MLRLQNITPALIIALAGWQVACERCGGDDTDDSGTTDDSADGCFLDAPGVTFTSPVDGSVLVPADNVGIRAELVGTDIDTDSINVVFTIDGLPEDSWEWDGADIVYNGQANAGAHGASVSVNDGCGTYSDDVSWIGNTPPEVTISADASYELGDAILVTGTVTDSEDPISSLDVSWELDGNFHAAASPDTDGNVEVDLTGQAVGSYTIALVAADEHNDSSASADFDVTEEPVVCVDVGDANMVLHMDEGTGDTLGDDSLHNQQAGLEGTSSWADGRWEGGVDLGGTGWIEVASPEYPTIWSTDYTIAGWISRNSEDLSVNEALFQQGDGTGTAGRTLLYLTPECNGANNVLTSSIGGSKVCGTTSIGADGWHHVAVVRDRSNSAVTLYVDGVEDGLGTNWMEFSDGEYLIGTNKTADNNFFDGVVDEFVIINEALDAAAVADLYTGPACAPTCADLPATPATWLAMDDGAGKTASDSSGNGYDFDLKIGTSWEAGTYGTAIHLNGTSAYAEADEGAYPDLNAGDFTLSLRARYDGAEFPTSDEGVDLTLIQTFNGSGQGRSLLYVDSSCGGQASTFIGGEELCAGSLRAGVWYHLAVTYDATSGETLLYVDGIEKASATRTLEFADGVMRLGSNQSLSPVLWEGPIDDFLIYERVLSADEMLDLHAGGSAYCLLP